MYSQPTTQIVLHLNDTAAKEYCAKERIETIIKKHSNFVGFPIVVDGSVVNSIKPLWLMPAKDVTDDDNVAFYRFVR
jgi:HSP90 family molecular chaperone